MFELHQVGARSYYIDCPAKIGIYQASENEVYLIDSGNDKDAGRKVRKLLDEKAWRLKGIINTHSNADHIGGNQYLQQQTGCKIFAHGVEAAFTQHPILEPSFLYGGYPCADLRHKFLLAAKSDVVSLQAADFPSELAVIPLPGHFFDMVGFRTPDNVVFLADCVSSESTLAKYPISFIYDIAAYLRTLDAVESMDAAMFVPAHAPATDSVKTLVQCNREAVHTVAEKIVAALAEPLCFEALLKRLFDTYNLIMGFEQYVLVGSTVRSYLSWLKDAGRITAVFAENMLIWKSVL